MEVIKANEKQYSNLNGFRNGSNKLEFLKDFDDNWIVGKEVLTDDKFLEIRNELEQLEVIPYNPKITEI